MKSRLLLLALALAGCSRTQVADDEFVVEGRLTEVEDGARIALSRLSGDWSSVLVVDTLIDGRFELRGQAVETPERMLIECLDEDADGWLEFWVANGRRVKISGKDKWASTWQARSAIPDQREENKFQKANHELIVRQTALRVERDEWRAKRDRAVDPKENAEYERLADSLDALVDEVGYRMALNDAAVMAEIPVSPIWMRKMEELAMRIKYGNLGEAAKRKLQTHSEALYARMSEQEKRSEIGHRITAGLFPPRVVEVGESMADAELIGVDGNIAHPADYQGKYLLLDFWSTGCAPCLRAMPEMKRLAEAHADQLTIVSISLDSEQAWREALREFDTSWVQLRDPNAYGGLAASYGVYGIPHYALIAPDGRLAATWSGYASGSLENKLKKYLE